MEYFLALHHEQVNPAKHLLNHRFLLWNATVSVRLTLFNLNVFSTSSTLEMAAYVFNYLFVCLLFILQHLICSLNCYFLTNRMQENVVFGIQVFVFQ